MMIELRKLSKSYYGENGAIEVLREVSLTIAQGEVFGVIGRSGAGKSTLVRCINRLEQPSSGSVVVNGLDLGALKDGQLRQARQRIGMVFQHFNLLSSRTVAQNVAFPLELAGRNRGEIRRTVDSLLDLVGLTDKRERYPTELSGGQKQRVGIARALASQPTVLLCDEATSALDPETTKSILALLKDINVKLGLTIVVITHEMSVITEICDRVAVLDQGQVVDEGPVFDVFTQPRSAVTRGFLRGIIDHELPTSLTKRLHNTPLNRGNPVLRILFTGHSANLPVLSEVVRRFDVLLNILQGNVDYIHDSPYGNIVVEAVGSGRDIQSAIDFIRTNSLRVEVLGHVVDHHRAVA